MSARKKSASEYYGELPKSFENHPFYGLTLDDEQLKFANTIINPDIDIVFVNALAGTGKAQPVDTEIPTPNGTQSLGDIKIGDYVFSADGLPTMVMGTYFHKNKRAYRVTLSDGRSTICAEDHLWSYYAGGGLSNRLVTAPLKSMIRRPGKKEVGGNIIKHPYMIPLTKPVQYGESRLTALRNTLSDGHAAIIHGEEYGVTYTTPSGELAESVTDLLYSLGYSAFIKEDLFPDTNSKVATHTVCAKIPQKDFSRIFKEKPIVKRDVRITQEVGCTGVPTRTGCPCDRIWICSIEDLGYECDMVCIYVDNPSHLYLTNDYIVTHNTTIATGAANILVQYGIYDGIIYIMSPYGEKKQGWLPGTITEKSSVYFEAFYQALVNCNVNPYTAVNDDSLVNQKNGSGYITCITDTFLRGSNLDNAVIILDEAQNYTVPQLKKTLTRVGKNAKVIVIGHTLQCDLDNPYTSGFAKYIEHFKDKERAAVCTLSTNHRSWISRCADEVQ